MQTTQAQLKRGPKPGKRNHGNLIMVSILDLLNQGLTVHDKIALSRKDVTAKLASKHELVNA